jgi:hypothetical protein
MLDLLAKIYAVIRLLWLEIGLLAKFCCRIWVALHRQIIENQGIDVTESVLKLAIVAKKKFWHCRLVKKNCTTYQKKED